jgi:hypothetical protein
MADRVETTGRFARYSGGLPHFAEVAVFVERRSERPGIFLDCTGAGFSSQGTIEDASATGYDSWKEGARAGAAFALHSIEVHEARVEIVRISGLGTDTNPSIVAAAAARAVWESLDVVPPADAVARVESIALSSWTRELDEIPRL